MKKFFIFFSAILLVVADQVVKVLVVKNKFALPKVIINGFLKFSYCENRGVAFSLGEGNIALFIVLNILLIGFVIFYYEKNREKFNRLGEICISLVVAGGASNLIDRIFRGFVVDFIDVNDFVNFAIFNVADIFITVGVFGLAMYYLLMINKELKVKNNEEKLLKESNNK